MNDEGVFHFLDRCLALYILYPSTQRTHIKRLSQLLLNLVQVKMHLRVEAQRVRPVEPILFTILVPQYEKLLIVVLIVLVAEYFLRLLQPVFFLPNVNEVPFGAEEEGPLACNVDKDRVVGSEVHALHEFLRALLPDEIDDFAARQRLANKELLVTPLDPLQVVHGASDAVLAEQISVVRVDLPVELRHHAEAVVLDLDRPLG